MAPQHIIVLIHGLQGNTGHMKYLEDRFKEGPNKEQFLVFNMKANDDEKSWAKNWSKTGDGVVNGGERLVLEFKERISKLVELDRVGLCEQHKISFVGSSLGGLYCRYVMGSLFNLEKQKIEVDLDGKCYEFQLENYVAMASPLISVRCLVSSFFYYGMKAFFYKGTGNDMVLDDSSDETEAIVSKMAMEGSVYFEALKSCKRRITLCSCKEDETKVPYQSSAIAPYREIKANKSDKCKSLPHLIKTRLVKNVYVDEEGAFVEDVKDGDKSRFYFNKDSKQDWIETMILNLRKLSWIRADIDLYHAQAAIVNDNRSEIADLVCTLWNL